MFLCFCLYTHIPHCVWEWKPALMLTFLCSRYCNWLIHCSSTSLSCFLPSGLHSAICFCEWWEPAETQIYDWVCLYAHVCGGLGLTRISLGCWCMSLELWKSVEADIWLAVMGEHDQSIAQGSFWPNVIRGCNDDGGSAQSEEAQKLYSDQSGSTFVNCLESDLAISHDVSAHQEKRSIVREHMHNFFDFQQILL